jgi:membrane protease YdiL (CAAX protease family)
LGGKDLTMQDPTELVIFATFTTAALLFLLAARLKTHRPVGHFGRVDTALYQARDLLGISAIYLIFAILVLASFGETEDPSPDISARGLIASIALQFLLAGGVACLVIKRTSLSDWLGLKWEKWPWVFLIAPGAVLGMTVFMTFLNASGYARWIDSLGVDAVQDSVKLLQESNDPLILGLMALAAVVAAPICEELVFRGYFYPVTKKFAGPWVGGICTALVFAAAHGNLAALFPLCIFGGLLVIIYEKTGSIWGCIAAHLCFNGLTVLIQIAIRYFHLPLESQL